MKVTITGDTVTMSLQDFLAHFSRPEVVASVPANLHVDITNRLDALGFKRHLQGFNYLRRAIEICVEDAQAIRSVIGLYDRIAVEFGTTRTRAERSMRHAIESAFVTNRPTNSEFIAELADKIRLEGK